ncbi:MAG: hypothetical protein Q4C05_05560 [Akkermansia sp.]|nr:hypothetical protein [Akkermansia sp.]
MNLPHRNNAKFTGFSWGICVLLSILVHVMMFICGAVMPTTWWTMGDEFLTNQKKEKTTIRLVKWQRQHSEMKESAKEKSPEKPIVKTSLEQESATPPEIPKFQSDKNTRAEGGRKAPDSSEVELPAQDGKESPELVLFDQKEQKGDISHEKETAVPLLNGHNENDVSINESRLIPPQQGNANEVIDKQNSLEASEKLAQQENTSPKKESAPIQLPSAVLVPQPAEFEEGDDSKFAQLEKLLLQSRPQSSGKKTYYDPIFGESSQPGFKTNERKTRQIGKFSLGRRPSVDVEKTVLGDYQMQVYRAIAKPWYYECERNRSLVEIGSITVRLLINKAGKVTTMTQMARSGASENQKAFTFRAIKNALLPPMPKEVQDSLIGEQMELHFTFNFSFY